jgi:hypothetical protein
MDRQEALKLYRKTRRRRMTPEATLQMCVVEHMRLKAMPGCFILSIPNEHHCSEARGAMLNRMGRMKGAADLMVIRPNLPMVFLELKAKGEKPSFEQLAFGKMVCDAGHDWGWSDNIDHALWMLRNCGALKPEAQFRRKAA